MLKNAFVNKYNTADLSAGMVTGNDMLELKYRVEKISKIKRVEDELFYLFFLRGL